MATATTTPAPNSSQIETTGPARSHKSRYSDPYLWHKLHSLSGIFPIGVFLIQHLIANSYALRGAEAYNTVIKVFGYLPFVAVMEIVIIYIPLLYHSIYGLFLGMYGKYNVGAYSYGRNWQYTMQRVTGVIALIYIVFHVYNTSLQKYILQWHHNRNPEDAISYAAMAGQMATPWMFAFYVIGIICVVFHFSSGIWNFCIRWGLTISKRSQVVSSYVCAAIFFIFTAIGLWTITSLHFAGHSTAAIADASTSAP